jgi:hypothetical protein
MPMIVQYGTYQHQVSSTGIVISSDVEENESGVAMRVKHSVSIEGRLRNPPGATPRDLDDLIAQMESAYSQVGQDFGMLHDDGRRSQAFWTNASTIGGIRVQTRRSPRKSRQQSRQTFDRPQVSRMQRTCTESREMPGKDKHSKAAKRVESRE